MNNEKKFLIPEAEIIEFCGDDVILTSDVGGIITEGETPTLP